MRSNAFSLLFTALGIGALAAFYLSRNQSAATADEFRCPTCNIILITSDTLRADHLGLYGYSRPTSPFIDAFAAESWVFDQAITPRPETNPSLISLLSGRDPHRTGVRRLFNHPTTEVPMLQKLLRARGWPTAAFVSNWVLRPELTVIHEGFDIFNIDYSRGELNRPFMWERTAEETNVPVRRWLDAHPREPFFLWVHYLDPHGPYTPPRDRVQPMRHSERLMIDKNRLPPYQVLPDVFEAQGRVDILDYVDRYDEEVQFMDAHFGTLVSDLRARGLLDRSLVIFSADHGESHYEHGYYLAHGRELYDNAVRIPLLIRFPESVGAVRQRSTALVSISDVAPTILDFLGIESMGSDGYSLLPLLSGRRSVRSEVFCEDVDPRTKRFLRAAVRTERYKLLMKQSRREKEFECYDLQSDPLEQHPEGCPDHVRAELEQSLAGFTTGPVDSSPGPGAPDAHFDEHDTRALKSLGYLN